MHEQDLSLLRQSLIRTRALVCAIRRLTEVPPRGTVADVEDQLAEVERDLVLLTEHVSYRESVSWGRRQPTRPALPRHEPNQWLQRPTQTTPADRAGVPVQRFGISGQRVLDEAGAAPRATGDWNQSHPRRRRRA